MKWPTKEREEAFPRGERLPLLDMLFDKLFAAHIHPKGFGDADAAVGLEVVLQEGDEHTGRSHHRVVDFFWRGDQASTSRLLTFRSARSPEQHSRVRTGMSRLRKKSTVFCHSLTNHWALSSGWQTTTISCFSN